SITASSSRLAFMTLPRGGLVRTERLERLAKLRREEVGLFPRREVSALRKPVVVDELGIRLLGPALGSLIELLGERAHRRRDLDVLRSEERELALPIETGRRDCRLRQPVEGDVVE